MNSSENSSEEETDQFEDGDSSGGTRRSYECTFCRRGFTNAQALGGHMNIHRKDRAKAKQNSTPNHNNSSSSFSNKLSIDDSFANSASPTPSRFYSIFEVHQGNYNMYFQPSSATINPRNPSPASYGFPFEYLNPMSHYHHHQSEGVNHQELLGANLSLQIGPNHVESTQKDGEVDLELRLGHHPY